MKHIQSFFLASFLLNQVSLPVQAQKPDANGLRSEQRKDRPASVHPQKKSTANKDQKKIERMHDRSSSEMLPPSSVSRVAVGSYFQIHQIEAARHFYDQPENWGFCPPGLAKKGTGCLPPGQAKPWEKGASLPDSVTYYELPRSVVLALGAPPLGYKYVRVASDILLIAIGTNMVMDAIEDLVR